MNKIQASILAIGFQEEDHKMYPHLYDFLQHLRATYEDVTYVGDDDRGIGLSSIDRDIKSLKDDCNDRRFMSLPRHLASLALDFWAHINRQRKLRKDLKNVKFKYGRRLVLAIDHTACFMAEKYFPGQVVFWSLDILAKDNPLRIKNGFLEKLITSKEALKAKELVIQDEPRKKLLEESVGANFLNTIYLPVSLNDSEFCRKASEKRQKKGSLSTVNIVQSGGIAKRRWSDQLIAAYQNWPTWCELTLRGFVSDIRDNLLSVKRKPRVDESIYDSPRLSQVLDNYDIGFVGYAETDSNHEHMENASAQLVEFLRLGIPVIGFGQPLFNDFINRQNIGIGVSSIEEVEDAIKKIVDAYSSFSGNARRLYELRFTLDSIFNNDLIKAFESLLG